MSEQAPPQAENPTLATPERSSPGGSSLWRSPASVALWAGLAISLVGDNLYRVGLNWTVTQDYGVLAGSVWLGLASAIPVALLGLLAGAVVDRVDRFRFLVLTDLVRAVVVGAIAVLFWERADALALLLVGAFALSAAGVGFTPALQAGLPDLLQSDRDRIVAFDALILTTMSVVAVGGPAVAGALLPSIGVGWMFVLDAVSFLASATAVRFVRSRIGPLPEEAAQRHDRPGVIASARAGLSFLLRHPVLGPQFLVFPVMEGVTYGLAFLLPAVVRDVFGAQAWTYGLLLGGYAVGRVAGSQLVSRTGLKGRRGVIFTINLLWQGVAAAGFALSGGWVPALCCYVLLGLPSGAAQVAMSSYLQTEVPREMRGRAFAAITSLVTWLMPLGPAAVGGFAAWQGPRAAVVLVAAVLLVCGGYIAVHPTIRKVC